MSGNRDETPLLHRVSSSMFWNATLLPLIVAFNLAASVLSIALASWMIIMVNPFKDLLIIGKHYFQPFDRRQVRLFHLDFARELGGYFV